MALKPCRECKELVSTGAKVCPKCGVSNPTGPSVGNQIAGVGCLVVILAIVVMVALGNLSPSGPPGADAPRPATAEGITNRTTCGAAISAFDSERAEAIRPISRYVIETMIAMDRVYLARGDASIMAPLDEDGITGMVAATVGHCRNDPKLVLHSSVEFVYRGVREMQVLFGVIRR